MPRLKLRVESALQRFLAEELTDEEFKREVKMILDEFRGKNLLYRNIGQLTLMMEKENPDEDSRFSKMWILLDQVDKRIREDCMREWKIKRAREQDIENIIKCDHIAKTRSGKDRRDFIERSVLNKRCYVAVIKGKPVGYTVLEYDFWGFGGAFVTMLMIHEEFRRRGIGSALIRYVENICKEEKLFVSTNQSNRPMQGLLDKLDYERSGIIHNLDPGDPELIYFKRITRNK